jgi:hypothetical protein
MQVGPDVRNGNCGQRSQTGDYAPPHAGQKHDRKTRAEHQHGGAKIGLFGDQRYWHQGDQGGDRELAKVWWQRNPGEVPGEHHRQGQLHDLGGLERRGAHAQPAARALGDDTDAQHRDQQEQCNGKQYRCQPSQVLGAYLGYQYQDTEGHDQSHQVLGGNQEIGTTGAEHYEQADSGQRQDGIEQRQIDMPAL